jgi:hypothetical protein
VLLTGSDVCQDGYLGCDLDVAPEESHKELGERTLIPLVEWVEDQFVTSISISKKY